MRWNVVPFFLLLAVALGCYTWGAIAGCGWDLIKNPSMAQSINGAVAVVIFVGLLGLMTHEICLAIRGRR